MKDNHLIHESQSIIEALKTINSIKVDPMVLFVLNDKEQVIGTITDGDVRRALIAGHKLDDKVGNVIKPHFNYLGYPDAHLVEHLIEQRALKMQLVPMLDEQHHLVEIINLETTKTKLPVDAVLMAGGKGERLRPLTEKTPKPLLHVGKKAIIDHNVDRLIHYGVNHINVTVNYLGEQLEEHFARPHKGVHVCTVREPMFLGTIGSVKFVKEFYHDTVLLMNSDLFTNIDYEEFYLHFRKNNADISVAAVPYTVSVPYGIFDLEGRDIKGLIEKLIEEGKKVIRFPLNGTWIDIGSKAEYEKAQELVKHIEEI